MKKLISAVTKIVKALNAKGFSFVSEDNCEDHFDYLTIEDRDIIVGDDGERQSWNVYLNEIKGTGDLTEVILETLGEPSGTVFVGGRNVCNWRKTKNLCIVFADDSVEIEQDYQKV